MIEVVMKRLGSYQYGWDKVESGDDALREAFGDFADKFIDDDTPSVSIHKMGDSCSVVLYRKLDDVREVCIPGHILRTAMSVKIRTNDDQHGDPHLVEHFEFEDLSIRCYDTRDGVYAVITFNYHHTDETAKRVFGRK